MVIEENGAFRVELMWDTEHDWDFGHYGTFCELPKHLGADHAQAGNDPTGGDFYIRNPGAWTQRDVGNGTDSWVRVDSRSYGWFKLAEHPKWEVEALMRDGLTEREAWKKALDRWPRIIEDLARGELYAVWMQVVVFWNDEPVGEATVGGVEVCDYVTEKDAVQLAQEHDLIDVAMYEAEGKIQELCKTAMLADRPDGATNAA